MAVLANDPAAPADLREKSLRLAAHLLEYDPQLRGGAGYARARELLDSGAALKQMQEIIDAQGPSACRNDVGKLTFDVARRRDGTVSEIDCLQLNRLARTAGAPIDKGAGIRIVQEDRRPRREGRAALPHLRLSTSRSSISPWRPRSANSGYAIDGRSRASGEAAP